MADKYKKGDKIVTIDRRKLSNDHPLSKKSTEHDEDIEHFFRGVIGQSSLALKKEDKKNTKLIEAIHYAVACSAKDMSLEDYYHEEFIEKGYTLAFTILQEVLSEGRLENISVKDLMLSLGIIIDKLVLVINTKNNINTDINTNTDKKLADSDLQQMTDEQLDVMIKETKETLTVVRRKEGI